MVKLNWLETFSIYIVVAIVMFFIGEQMSLNITTTWFSLIIWLIIYLGISSIIIKVITGKNKEESKQNKKYKNLEKKKIDLKKMFNDWWKKQKRHEKNLLIILLSILIIIFVSWILVSWSIEDLIGLVIFIILFIIVYYFVKKNKQKNEKNKLEKTKLI